MYTQYTEMLAYQQLWTHMCAHKAQMACMCCDNGNTSAKNRRRVFHFILVFIYVWYMFCDDGKTSATYALQMCVTQQNDQDVHRCSCNQHLTRR